MKGSQPVAIRGRRAARALLAAVLGAAAASSIAFEFTDRPDGISCPFIDGALAAPWPGGRRGWVDAAGVPDGPQAYAVHPIGAGDTNPVRRIDVTPLVRAWATRRLAPHGLVVRLTAGGWMHLHAREAAAIELRPQLRLSYGDGRTRYVEAVADSTIDCATIRGLGTAPTLLARGNTLLVLRFDGAAIQASGTAAIARAELVMVRAPGASNGAFTLSVFAMRPPWEPLQQEAGGIAARYPRDSGIASDPDVLFADGFDGGRIDSRWKQGMPPAPQVVRSDEEQRFEPLNGPALRVRIARGRHEGLDLRYPLRDASGAEPEQLHFRYYLRLAPSWAQVSDAGKLPGFAGTYGKAGWGGRAWDGARGWSLRGSYSLPLAPGHPGAGRIALGTYAYHAAADSKYGQLIPWTRDALSASLQVARWYCIEQMLRLNTPGRPDGVLKVWVDGRLVLMRDDLRLRDVPEVRIEEVWMNVFHGGTDVARADVHAYIDQVVIARRYIGILVRP